ncbi:hypothetical protein LSTR_LSTR014309 [Laodelphax striatellus]|uniref:Uncharacterized protein n=1 Tax=Laodelphax striatellus TaxID=195883 RepID=A0A482X1A9_LAOST|nr:hypothetical protein LSTR_LSTR014309 [Laodelphax striatellus]
MSLDSEVTSLADNCGTLLDREVGGVTSLDRKVGGVTSLGGKTEGGVTSLDDRTPRDTDAGRKEGVMSQEERGEMLLDALEDNCGTSLDGKVGGVTSLISEERKGEMSLDSEVTSLADNCGTLLDREVGGVTSLKEGVISEEEKGEGC